MISTCCPAWIKGAGTGQDWNDEGIVRLRKAILDGDYSHCVSCPRRVDGDPQDELEDDHQPIMERGPKWIYVANDPSCNLHCPSCRECPIQLHPRDVDMGLVAKWLPDAEMVSVSNTGDAFGSRTHREWLQKLDGSKYPKLEVELFTNGLLLPRYWDSLHKIHKNIVRVRMSIDAATAETYERVRPPGKWHQVTEALDFISKLNLKFFVCNFCVQEANVNEAPDFVDLATSYGASEVVFNVLRVKDYFDKLGVRSAKKEDIQRILEDERMSRPEVFCPMLRGAIQ